MADFPLKTHKAAKVAIDEQTRMATGSLQWLLEKRDKIPISRGNTLNFMICGEDGFKSIAKDLRRAKATVDIVCWGFDPGMEIERSGDTWPRGIRYGELLKEITTRKENPVTVRLLIWSTPRGSALQNNMPGYSDVDKGWSSVGSPVVEHFTQKDPYNNPARHQWCVDWWAENLPGGKSDAGKNPRLRVVLREVSEADATQLLSVAPAEEDKPVTSTFSAVDERSGMEAYATHHQKPILIDYDWDDGSAAVGYVMGLNSVTDYWDRTAHAVDDPMRETLSPDQINAELDRETDTQQPPSNASLPSRLYDDMKQKLSKPQPKEGLGHEHYLHGRPYQDYACRVVGPALAQLHYNFENGWSVALGGGLAYPTPPKPPAKIQTAAGNPAHLVQIVRTQAHEQEKSIKEVYLQASACARNYIYIENQYFFYPEWARHLKQTRQQFCADWTKKSGKPVTEIPKLHLFIVIPHPERKEMVPRTYDTLTELGEGSAMPDQAHLADQGKLSQPYPDSHPGVNGGQVIDRPSAQDLDRTLGLEVSVARLRTSGPDSGGKMAYREIYIHSKLMIIDDAFITVGSANLNERSMSIDSEINIAATGQLYAADLRQRVFTLMSTDIPGSGDPKELPAMFRRWNDLMASNDDQRQNGAQMKGFLLPFEDYRSTTTLLGSISVPSSSDTAASPDLA